MSVPRQVLLVEDDAELADAYRVVLKAHGFETVTAETAQSAVDLLQDGGPDLVVVDLGLPDLSGSELVERLRRVAPEARLIVLTGQADAAIRRRCVEAGADDYLVKPVSGAELAEKLETA